MGNYVEFDPDANTNDLEPFVSNDSLAAALRDISTEDDRTAAVNADIDASESEVDSYLAPRYSVPLTTIPDVIVDATAALTVERIYNRGHGPPDAVAQRAERARVWLRDIAKGTAVLAGVSASPSTSVGSNVVRVEADDRELTRDSLGFW